MSNTTRLCELSAGDIFYYDSISYNDDTLERIFGLVLYKRSYAVYCLIITTYVIFTEFKSNTLHVELL